MADLLIDLRMAMEDPQPCFGRLVAMRNAAS